MSQKSLHQVALSCTQKTHGTSMMEVAGNIENLITSVSTTHLPHRVHGARPRRNRRQQRLEVCQRESRKSTTQPPVSTLPELVPDTFLVFFLILNLSAVFMKAGIESGNVCTRIEVASCAK